MLLSYSRHRLLLVVFFALAGPSWGASIEKLEVGIDIYGFTVGSQGIVEYDGWQSELEGYHRINDGALGTVAENMLSDPDDEWLTRTYNETLEAGTIYEHCYRARLTVTGEGVTGAKGTHQRCAPPPPPDDDPGDIGAEPDDEHCPILLDIAGDGYSLSGLADPVIFDLNADGTLETGTWTEAARDEAFLWLDYDGNGIVNDGRELFGNVSYKNGFEKLAIYDQSLACGNGDGAIDSADAVWAKLLLWTDYNHDGISQSNEIAFLADSPIVRLDTSYRTIGKRDQFGNKYRFVSRLDRIDGPGAIKGRNFYDIIFVRE